MNKSIQEIRLAAKQGDACAQFDLGLLYQTGTGVAQDFTEAMTWYKKAAEQGLADAQLNIGYLYDKGNGVTQNAATATQWYLKAALQCDVIASYNLGDKYEKGQGVEQNYIKAHYWYNVSSTFGNTYAQDSRSRIEKKMTSTQIKQAQEVELEWAETNNFLPENTPCKTDDDIYS
jgi:TPR repeat protein